MTGRLARGHHGARSARSSAAYHILRATLPSAQVNGMCTKTYTEAARAAANMMVVTMADVVERCGGAAGGA